MDISINNQATAYHFLSTPYRIDRKLYKYFSNIDYAIDCIKNRRIHLDDPSQYNDPFDLGFRPVPFSWLTTTASQHEIAQHALDCLLKTGSPQINGEIKKQIVSALVSYIPQCSAAESPKKTCIKQGLHSIYDNLNDISVSFESFIKIIDAAYIDSTQLMHLNCKASCFSEVNDSILMWSYYANSHRGVCIEFDLSKLDMTKRLNEDIISNLKKVHYSPFRPNPFDITYNDVHNNYLLTKSDAWAHEHEWRIICETQEEYLPFDCISKVYTGARFCKSGPKYDELLLAIGTHDLLSIQECQLSQKKYSLEFVVDPNFYYNLYLVQALANAKNSDVRFDELRKVLESYGYTMNAPRSGSSHYTFRKPGCQPITIPKHEPIKRVYVEMVKQVVESEASNNEDAE